MYPYHCRFSHEGPERAPYEKGMFRFYDGLHYLEPMYPFDIIRDESRFLTLSQYNSRTVIVPPAMGYGSPCPQREHLYHSSAQCV